MLEECGLVDYYSLEQLKTLEIDPEKTKLVMLMQCHSEPIGKVFFDLGVQHVICVQASRQIDDEAAVFFTNLFYEQIFVHGKTICQAYFYAKAATNDNEKFEGEGHNLWIFKTKDARTGQPHDRNKC